MLNLTPYDLSVDRLDVHAVSPVMQLTIKTGGVVPRNIYYHPPPPPPPLRKVIR